MKFATWNVNGLRAAWHKGLQSYIEQSDANIISIQETKLNAPYDELEKMGYQAIWNYADRKGYSGTMCLVRQQPMNILYGIGNVEPDTEGRIITLCYPNYYMVNAYVPNSTGGIKRWYYRLNWDVAFAEYLYKLQSELPVIVCGDFNVAHEYIDIYPENLRNDENPAGFKSEEREALDNLLENGFVDCFRYLHPDEVAYTWWSNRLSKRQENRGWRIDYCLVSNSIKSRIKSVETRSDIHGSDHCPLEMVLEL